MRKALLLFIFITGMLHAGYSDFSEQFSQKPTKQQQWKQTAEFFDQVTDGMGMGLDQGIKDTVVVLNLLGLKTDQSCEGHLTWGNYCPWVRFSDERVGSYLTQFHELLEKYPNADDEGKRQILHDVEQVEADIYHLLKPTRKELNVLLEEFYQTINYADLDKTLVVNSSVLGCLSLQSFGAHKQVYYQENERAEKLKVYQVEMEAFTNFLIAKWLAS